MFFIRASLFRPVKTVNFAFVKILVRKMSKVAVCQVTSTTNKEDNLKAVETLIQQASKQGVKFVFFPEAVDYVALSAKQSVAMSEELTGHMMSQYKQYAVDNKVWLSIGGFHEKNLIDPEKIFNSHVIINDNGKIVSIYRKVHLFDVQIPEKNINLKESSYVTSGTSVIPPVQTPIGCLGLSICYDMRFPEISTCLRKLGAEILTFPSAFMTSTGPGHWESLLRARAIENQCYVIAAAQYGVHNDKRQSHGHALIVDPWGKIIAQCDPFTSDPQQATTNESLAIATLDLEELRKIRAEMPVFQHRRSDVYSLNITALPQEAAGSEGCDYMFAHKVIPSSTVFYKSALSYAFTNIRCVVPGHVLVCSIRVVERLADLTQEEVADLFQTVVKVQRVMECAHGTNSSNVCVQDGVNSGQTVPHVHVHILPRKGNDFACSDEIYEQLAKHDRDANPEPVRSDEEMSQEATELRKLFSN